MDPVVNVDNNEDVDDAASEASDASSVDYIISNASLPKGRWIGYAREA